MLFFPCVGKLKIHFGAPRIWFNREEGDRYHTDDALIPGSWLRI